MSEKVFTCRKITEADLEMVMNWRMQPDVTKYMNTDPKLTLSLQKAWFDKITQGEALHYWVIEIDHAPCGVINLTDVDEANRRCMWAYYVAVKELRSFLLSVSLEASLYDYVFDVLGMNKITSIAFTENTGVIKLHELCGCDMEGILKKHIYKNETYHDICVQSMFKEKWNSVRHGINYQKISFE